MPKGESEACTSTCSFVVHGEGEGEQLDLVLHQRSSDVAIGLVFDVVVWSILLHLVCREVTRRTMGTPQARKLTAGKLTMHLINAHVYDANVEAVREIATRSPKHASESLPILEVADGAPGLFDIAHDDEGGPSMLSVKGYKPHPFVSMAVATGQPQSAAEVSDSVQP